MQTEQRLSRGHGTKFASLWCWWQHTASSKYTIWCWWQNTASSSGSTFQDHFKLKRKERNILFAMTMGMNEFKAVLTKEPSNLEGVACRDCSS
jgi:hypothetical protein